MNVKTAMAVLIVGIGCGEVTAEPIRSASLDLTSVEVDAPESGDPYACQVHQVGTDHDGPYPFVQLGELAYAGTCEAQGSLNRCWYTADNGCEQADRECGGFHGNVDSATVEYQVTGAQHMICAYSCVRDDDCPAASTGTARAACMHGPEFDPATETGQCMLACGAGETCPDGFVCIQPGLAFGTSDGTYVDAPAQCVQLHRLTLSGAPFPQ